MVDEEIITVLPMHRICGAREPGIVWPHEETEPLNNDKIKKKYVVLT